MNTNTNKLRSFVVLGLLVVIVLQVCAVFSAPVKYVHLLTADLLGWFWGALTVILYWVLYFLKVRAAHTSGQPQRNATQNHNDDNDTPDFIVKNGYELLQTIQPIFRIPFFGIPKFWHKYYVVKRGKTYLLLNRPFFSFYTKTTDLCSLHRPDLVKEWLQFFNLSEIVIFSDEDKSRLIKIWVSRKNSLPIIADLIENITTACKANDVKRIVGETAPHTGKKK